MIFGIAEQQISNIEGVLILIAADVFGVVAIWAVTHWQVRKQAREALVSEWSDVMERAPLGVATVSLDGHFLQVNYEIERITERTSEELSRLKWQDITSGGDLERDEAAVAGLVRGEGYRYTLEKDYDLPNGGKRPVRIHVSVIGSTDDRRFLVFIEDRSAEENVAARARAAVAAHEKTAQRREKRIASLEADLAEHQQRSLDEARARLPRKPESGNG